jgi:hypothetical protein
MLLFGYTFGNLTPFHRLAMTTIESLQPHLLVSLKKNANKVMLRGIYLTSPQKVKFGISIELMQISFPAIMLREVKGIFIAMLNG